MIIYVDTEFTDLTDTFGPIRLISVGLVAENGLEMYFELTDNYQEFDCSEFVIENVLPHLDNSKHGCLNAQAVSRLCEWIENFGETVHLATDAPHYDWSLIKELLAVHRVWPNNLYGEPISVDASSINERYEHYFEYQPLAIRHHALWDARALKTAKEGIND